MSKPDRYEVMLRSVFLFCAVTFGLVTKARADYCNDEPLTVIIKDNQQIYYTTRTLCTSWCLVDPAWTQAHQDRALSVLMTAITQHRPLTFFFPGACAVQPVFAKSELFIMGR